MTVLLTGAAGFIGYHTAEALLARGDTVVGVDDLNDYYDVRLKAARLARLTARPGFRFLKKPTPHSRNCTCITSNSTCGRPFWTTSSRHWQRFASAAWPSTTPS